MSEQNQKPIETFSQKDLDCLYGELNDLYAEAGEIRDEGILQEKTDHIMCLVTNILTAAAKRKQFDLEIIVINSKHHAATLPVARHFKLDIAQADFFPEKEVFVTTKDNVRTLIISRVSNVRGYIPDTMLKGVKIE